MAKHVGDTTGVVIAPSDVAGSTALHRLEFLFCDLCVCGFQTQVAYSRDGLTMAWYARVLTNSEELWILRLTKPSALFALEVTVAMCLFQLRSDVIVIPRYLADLTFSRASLWSLYGHFLRVTERILHLLGLNSISHFVSQFASLFRSSCRIVRSVFDLI